MNYEKICEKILESNEKIRYAAVYDYGELVDKIRPGITSYLSREETETSLSQAIYRWSTRKKTANKIGVPIFALAKYEKIYRITIPIGGAGLILITTELDADVNKIVDKVLEIRDEFVNN
ncbi:MAG: hypothetical protein MT334_05080 [Candidatus Nitrosopumilus limneticus]|nr:hypothetical protein [Candidatus Nitrosopumilus limneticus]MDA0669668.1 hypothetical protein [Thermoproteota archaeon]MSS86695.1 hypothetical protein [Nitrosopumilus sp.]PHY04307.1 MAG: hypothetical protein CK526_03720 [Nitrososphaerota archaeon]MDA0854002.1 hypothetical protein [Thermoproteota archaeon]